MGRIAQLYLPGNHYNIGTAAKIYARQCSSTVRTLLEAYGGDVTDILATAEKARLNKRQREALREFRVQKENDYEQSLWDQAASSNSQKILECIGHRVFPKDQVTPEFRRGMLKQERQSQKDELRKEYCEFWHQPDPVEEAMEKCSTEDLSFEDV